jgi:CubicO group peptidase (beta-lactamase class C family)
MEPLTLFRIASLSKPLGGALALTMIRDEVLGLDDEVARWLPELGSPRVLREPGAPLDDTVEAVRPILVSDLLGMTAGFGLLLGDSPLRRAMAASELIPGPFPPPLSHDEFMARLGALPLALQPGEGWLYHTAADALAVLLARAGGRPCAELLRARITGPLGMADTAFFASEPTRLATAYMPRPSGLELLDPPGGVFSRPPQFEALGSGVVSTLPDYLGFLTMLATGGGPVLDPAQVSQMGSDQLDQGQRDCAQGFIGPGRSWGLMVEVQLEDNDSELTRGMFGWMGGCGTTAYVDPGRRLAGALFTQRAMETSHATAVFKAFWRAVLHSDQTSS